MKCNYDGRTRPMYGYDFLTESIHNSISRAKSLPNHEADDILETLNDALKQSQKLQEFKKRKNG